MADKPKYTRQSLLELPEFAHIKEAMELTAQAHLAAGRPFNPWKPIREIPFNTFFDKADKHSLENNHINPNLSNILFSNYGMRIGDMARSNGTIGGVPLRETVNVPNSLSALKIFDEIIEGAEPWSDWKQYTRNIDMDAPKVNVPITKYTDTVGADVSGTNQKGITMYKESGTGSVNPIGGKRETVELDTSGTNGSFRGRITVERNDVKDNNFLAVEQSLKDAGNEFYYKIGVTQLTELISFSTNTATKAALDLAVPIQSEFEALSNVIRSKFPGEQRNRADTMFINPADAFLAVATSTGASGTYPFLSRFLLGPTDRTDVVNNSGLASSLGLRNVWETPQQTVGTVTVTKRDIAFLTGIREDLTIENFDLSPGGLYESELLVRLAFKGAHTEGIFTITAFNV